MTEASGAAIEGDAGVRTLSRRAKIESLGLLIGMLGILLFLVLAVGSTLPVGP